MDTEKNNLIGSLDSKNQLDKIDLVKLILLTFFTIGAYIPFYLFNMKKKLDKLNPNKTLNKSLIIFYLVFYILLITSSITSLYLSNKMKTSFDIENAISAMESVDQFFFVDTVSDVIDFINLILLLVISFQLKNILNDYFNNKLKKNVTFSGIYTFFFTIYYLQYKINQQE